jgi:hypothetical protein
MVLNSFSRVTGGKAGGHRTLSGVIICCKRWSRSCRGKCSTAHCLLVTGGKPEGIVLSQVSSSVANVGLARAEKSARQLVAGNWDQLAARNWGKSGGQLFIKSMNTPANRATCWKRWCCLCGGTCAGDLGLGQKRLEGIVLPRVSSSVANVGLARAEESARQLIACW